MNDHVIEYLTYQNALKGNYRKGIKTMERILANPAQAEAFAGSLGAVSVVLGVPVEKPDRNSEEILALLQSSDVIDRACLTWLSQWYPDAAADYDEMYADPGRCTTVSTTALMWRAVGSSPVGAGKVIATLAGQSCNDFAGIKAVASSATAMAAVAASATAVNAIAASNTAISALKASPLLKSVTKNVGSTAVTMYSGKCFIVYISGPYFNSAGLWRLANRTDGVASTWGNQTTGASTSVISTEDVLGGFTNPTLVRTNGSSAYDQTIYYIPCG